MVLSALFSQACTEPLASAPSGSGLQSDGAQVLSAASGSTGAIATAHPLASAAGLDVLQRGGNAVDAAVAASMVISVVRPQSTGIGGGGFLLLHQPGTVGAKAFDFRERAPAAARRRMYIDGEGRAKAFVYAGRRIEDASANGHLAVATPGLIAGLWQVHKEFGRLPWPQLVAPAISIAEHGFPVYRSLHEAIAERREVLQHFAASRQLLLTPEGQALPIGSRLLQPDLAKTLGAIAEHGADGFYRGWVAERLVQEMRSAGGLLTAADLAGYQVKRREPLTGRYRGYRILAMPPPSSGGVHIIEMLNMLAKDELKQLAAQDPAAYQHLLAEVMRRAFFDRAKWLGDPDFVQVPVRGLTALPYAQVLRQSIGAQSTPSKTMPPQYPLPYESDSTTHISVVDAEGRAVSTTQTINGPLGSGVVAKGTGIILNNEMDDFSINPGMPNQFGLVGSEANAVAAKKTPLSSMSPSLVFAKDGQLRLVLGSPGGPRIINATLQVMLGVLALGLPLEEAMLRPRIHHQWLPDKLRVESSLPGAIQADLQRRGHTLDVRAQPIGDVQAIEFNAGQWRAVSDPRSDGEALAY